MAGKTKHPSKLNKEDDTIAKIAICIGAHWPDKFVPEDKLTECVNDFLEMPRPDLFLQLIRDGELKLKVRPDEAKGQRLVFSLS